MGEHTTPAARTAVVKATWSHRRAETGVEVPVEKRVGLTDLAVGATAERPSAR